MTCHIKWYVPLEWARGWDGVAYPLPAFFFLKWPRTAGRIASKFCILYEASIAQLLANEKMARSGQVTELAFERAADFEVFHTLLQTKRDHKTFEKPSRY